MSQLKPLTKDTVLVVAQRIMLKTGFVTSLEVKEELRKQQFRADQDGVSAHMIELSTEEDWKVGDTGNYRVYSGLAIQHVMNDAIVAIEACQQGGKKIVKVVTTTPAAANSTANQTSGPSSSSTSNNSGNIEDPIANPAVGDWEANTVVPGHQPLYYDSSIDRGRVRTLYAKATGTSYNDARARKKK